VMLAAAADREPLGYPKDAGPNCGRVAAPWAS